MRFRLLLFLPLAGLLTGCGSIAYELPGHSAQGHTAPVTLRQGEHRTALSTPARLPVPGGFELALASENPGVVAVERAPGFHGAARLTLVARAPGTTTVHYVNRYVVPTDAADPTLLKQARDSSLGAFTVTVLP
jgi:hypothetical protein